MKPRILQALDSLAHFLYCPTMLGKGIAVSQWHHHIHLIPDWLLKPICDRYDRSVWAEFDTPEDEIDAMMLGADEAETFCEDDEDPAAVWAAFKHGEKGVTAPPWPGRVHVDFNDIEADGAIFARQQDAEWKLVPGVLVLLHDGEGNTTYGHVAGPGPGGGAFINLLAGSWRGCGPPPQPRITGWTCQHMTITSMPGILGKPTSGCDCEMRPVYANAA